MAVAGKDKGKSGGSRVITCFKVTQTTVYLLTIFDKSEQENIVDKDLISPRALLATTERTFVEDISRLEQLHNHSEIVKALKKY